MLFYDDCDLNQKITQVVERELHERLETLRLGATLNVSSITDPNNNDGRLSAFELLDKELYKYVRLAFNPLYDLAVVEEVEVENLPGSDPDYKARPFHKPSSPASYLMPRLLLYSWGALIENQASTPDPLALKATAAWEIMLCAISIIDDAQDHDKPVSLEGRYGPEICMTIGIVLLEIGQELLFEVSQQLFLNLLSCEAIFGKGSELIKVLHDLCYRSMNHLLQIVPLSQRGQLLDLQEAQVSLSQRFSCPQYYLTKASLKSGTLVSNITSFGAALGLTQSILATPEAFTCTGSDVGLDLRSWQAKWSYTLSVYRRFGFCFGLVLQLVTDLQDFLSGFPDRLESSRDLKYRQLTLPVVYGYESLNERTDKQSLLTLWQQGLDLMALIKSKDEPTLRAAKLDTDSALAKLLDAQSVIFSTTAHTLTLAIKHAMEAREALVELDPDLQKAAHRIMLETLEKMLQAVRLPAEYSLAS